MTNASPASAQPTPAKLRGRATIYLVLAIIFWLIFLFALLGTIASALLPVAATATAADPNAGYILGRILGTIFFLGVPLALATVFTVQQSRLRARARALESGRSGAEG